jgi:hypothetical protein
VVRPILTIAFPTSHPLAPSDPSGRADIGGFRCNYFRF